MSVVRRVWRFFVGSPAAQLTAGGVAAVLVTGAIIGGGALLRDANHPVSAAPAAQVREPQVDPGPPPVVPATESHGADQGLGAAASVPAEPAGPPVAAPADPPPPTQPALPARVRKKAATVTYDGIAGLGCTGRGTSYSNHGWFKNGNAGWWTLAYGSTREGGCDGRFDDMPMSGKPHEDTPGQAMLFGFQVGAARQTCALSIFVPTSSSSRDVAAVGVRLAVLSGVRADSPLYTSPAPERFIAQRDHHSTWLSLGSYPVGNGAIGVKITNRGYSAGYPMTDPHIAGGAVRARCTAP